MENIILPITAIILTFTLGLVAVILMKKTKGKQTTNRSVDYALKTAQEFINVKNIHNNMLYTNDGFAISYIRINNISIDLYSKNEKSMLVRQLTSELSDIVHPFKFIALSRPVDISPIIHELNEDLKEADGTQKVLLRKEITEMSNYALSGEIVERQFYISIWESCDNDGDLDLIRRAHILAEKFSSNGISANVVDEKEIVKILNLINNPSYSHLEDSEYKKNIPVIEGVYE